MHANIIIPFTKNIFDIINANPEDINGLSEQELAKLEKKYNADLEKQYLIEAHNWCNNNLKNPFIIMWAENSGNEEIMFEIQTD